MNILSFSDASKLFSALSLMQPSGRSIESTETSHCQSIFRINESKLCLISRCEEKFSYIELYFTVSLVQRQLQNLSSDVV